MPVNFQEKDACFFKNTYFKPIPLKVYELSNTIVTTEGICLINNGIVKESIHGYRDKITIYSLMAQLNMLKKKTIIIDNPDTFLLIHSPEFGYYHWLTESIPRILMVKSRIKELTLLLPLSLKNVEFVRESLKPFDFKGFYYIPDNKNIKLRHLVLPRIKPFCTVYYPETTDEIRKYYTGFAATTDLKHNSFPARLFISAAGNEKNDICDFRSLRILLDKYRIRPVNLAEYSFYEQIQMIQRAKLVISFTGDYLACINFMQRSNSILELIKTGEETEQPDLRFFNLASCLGLDYYYQFCESATGYTGKKSWKIKIETDLLEMNIKMILHN